MNIMKLLSLSMLTLLLFSNTVLARATPSANPVVVPGNAEVAAVPTRLGSRTGVAHSRWLLRHILAQPPFQQWRLRQHRRITQAKNPLWDSIGKQWDRLMKWLGRYFHPQKHRALAGHQAGGSFSFANFLEILAMVLGIALVTGIVMVLFRWQAIGKAAAASTDGLLSRDKIQQAMEQGDALAMASDSWMRAARQFGSDGDFRAMYRAMYLSLLAGLHETGKIRFRRSHTNWHYVRDFHGDKPERALFGSLTDLFDHVWYGRKLYPDISSDALRDQIRGLIVPSGKENIVNPSGIPPAHREDPRA
ncbi:MAG: DUF4129 domain-containing protein [Phycisphaerae bacterium]